MIIRWGASKPNGPATSCTYALQLVALLASSPLAHAQVPRRSAESARDTATRTSSGTILVAIGSVEDEARSLRPLAGDTTSVTRRLVRSPSSEIGPVATGAAAHVQPVLPSIRSVYNSALPYNANEGALWAGRGENVLVRAGFIAEIGRVRAVVAPEFAYSQNLPFDVFPAARGYSAYASWLHTGPTGGYSVADLPMRFGDVSHATATLGQTSLIVRVRGVEVGATTEAEWWGPGQQLGIVMSDAAPGVPRLFVRTATPIHTRLGDVEARLFTGTLTESLYFDENPNNNYRSLVGAAASLAPAAIHGLVVGVERTVVRPEAQASDAGARWFDVLRFWTPAPRLTPTGVPADTARADQLIALTARQIFPSAGVEVYAEWARQSPPRSFREFLLGPQESQGYTLGLQWLSVPIAAAGPRGVLRGARVRLGTEVSNLEQTVTFTGRAVRDFYSGAASPQGYTQRGEPVGAFTGPGSSSQWLRAELRNDAWQLGSFAGRIRWENDALYRVEAPNFYRHDVSLLGGLRATRRAAMLDARAELTYQTRYNYMFQNGLDVPGGLRTVNVHNVTLAVSLAPR